MIETQEAPDFSLRDQNGTDHILSQYRGSWVLLYFYPKDDTPGCTKEACSLRDTVPDFFKLNTIILGVSVDTEKSHKKFSEKYILPFTLLADTEKKVVKLYGVWGRKKFMGREYDGTSRRSFLIDPNGIIRKIYKDVQPALHAQEVIDDLDTLKRGMA